MTQLRVWDFGAPRKSQYLNDHFVGIVPTKRVYDGYNVRETGPASLNLDIKLDGSPTSILMTEEGVRIEETSDLSNAVTIAPHPTLDRIDYVVAAHQYTNTNIPQTYEVIEGTAGSPPAPPASVPQYKVLLATVYVPAGATVITNDLINQSNTVNLGDSIGRDDFLELRPDPQNTPGNTVFINAGTYVKSDGTDVISVPDDVGSALFFPPVTAAGRERYDLLGLDDTGTAVIVPGAEASAGFGDAPVYPTDVQIIAEVLINEVSVVSISQLDIRDVRFFFNLGGGGGGGGDCCSGIVDYEIYAATAQQDVFDLGFTFAVASDRLHVLVNGVKQIIGADYVETDDDTITFTVNRSLGEYVEFVYYGSAGCPTVRCPAPTVYENHISTANQTVFNLSTGYLVGKNSLWVLVNGVRQGVGTQIAETNATTVTFFTPLLAGQEVTFIQMGEGGGNIVTSRQEFTATTSQTLFTLTFSYVGGQNELFVWAAGALMQVGVDYTETGPTAITFNVGRPAGQQVVVARIGTSSAAALRLWEKQTAVGSQTVFNLLGTYVPGGHGLQVYQEGSLLTVIDDYTETSPNAVTLVAPATVGDTLIFMVPGGDVVACSTGSDLGVEDEGIVQGLAQIMDFTGTGVTATVAAGKATVNIPGGAGLLWQVIAANTPAVNGNGYLINAGGNVTVTLPASPSEGQQVGIADAAGMAETYILTIDRNGENIRGNMGNLILDKNWSAIVLVYVNASSGWVASGEFDQQGGGGVPSGSLFYGVYDTAPLGFILLTTASYISTIGNAGSGADRANADTVDLFGLVWNSMADAQAPVSGGRGASAVADFTANKTITIPDVRGRSFLGTGQGATLTDRVHGDSSGAETHQLSTAELASHAHLSQLGVFTAGGNYPMGATVPNGFQTNSLNSGSSVPHNNMQPWLALNVICKL